MLDEERLRRLAELYGIEPQYYDIWGNLHKLSARTAVELLGGMGVPAENGAEVDAALERAWRSAWLAPLGRVRVLNESEELRVRLNLPEGSAHGDYVWTFLHEDGGTESGGFNPSAREPVESCTIDGVVYSGYELDLPVSPAPGYHKIEITRPQDEDFSAGMPVIVSPHTCYQPDSLEPDGRVWGVSAQLNSLRSRENWGIGDFTDLARFVEAWASLGADIIGVNPLHTLFPHNPSLYSPYSPSSRCFINVLYIDIRAVEDFRESSEAQKYYNSAEVQDRIKGLREAKYLDNAEVSALKLKALDALYRSFRENHIIRGGPRADAFREFVAEGSETLYLNSLFEAIQEHFALEDPGITGWPDWPQEYRDPSGAAVRQFAESHRERVEFYSYLQWQASLQLDSAGRRSMELGLEVGLYQDLAVGSCYNGADVWSGRELYAHGVSIGAPPDDFNLKGQSWGLPPMVPSRLAEAAYAPFIEMLRKNMRSTGALRIDHIMGLMRQFWVPVGREPADGAYVRYPFGELMGIVALESRRNRCMVVGEDLGTVPPAVPEAMLAMGMLSSRVFYWEGDENGVFRPPAEYTREALVSVSTHDLPTLAGFWQGRDITERKQTGSFPSEQAMEMQVLERHRSRAAMLVALEREGLLPDGVRSEDPGSVPEMTTELSGSVHRYLARTPSKVLMVQFEDAVGETEQVNLPGTHEERPNWRRRLPVEVEDIRFFERITGLAAVLGQERPGKARPQPPVEAPPEAGIPVSTYRLQFNAGFTFKDAADIVPYLNGLGISHVYSSPCLKTRPGSAHGYDIIDHSSLNPELGEWEDYERFTGALKDHGMGQLLDIVPNHMAVAGCDNAWWLDLLENGPASVYAGYFDIDWGHARSAFKGKLTLPVLEAQYGDILEKGELSLIFDPESGEFSVLYHNHRFPVDPGRYPLILEHRIDGLAMMMGPDDPRLTGFQSLITSFGNLPPQDEADPQRLMERNRDKDIFKAQLASAYKNSEDIAAYVDGNLREFNGSPARPESFDLLHGLLQSQGYRLAYWRVAADEINYRRFFDINELAGLRTEEPDVFEKTHGLVIRLVAEGRAQGLRVDHPDGLYDPRGYFRSLQSGIAWTRQDSPGDTGALLKTARGHMPLYVVAEKILAPHERLPEDWPVHGTTGYDFTRLVDGLFVEPGSEAYMDRLYSRFTGSRKDYRELLAASKKLIMESSLSSELSMLAKLLSAIAESDRRTRDFTLDNLTDALRDIVACFPVYRTYITGEDISEHDRHHVEWAVGLAKKYTRTADVSVFDFIRDVVLFENAEEKGEEYRAAAKRFTSKLQQYTGPVSAKGMEDTAFYIYNRLVSLNEVGGDPARFGTGVQAFHQANQERSRKWPHSMLSTCTHDSKRSADVRMRINAISEMPREWSERAAHWSRINKKHKRDLDGKPAPGKNDEYLLYQTLLGAWPEGGPDQGTMEEFAGRMEHYMLKAAREAKVHMSWINPNKDYEEALSHFVRSLLDGSRRNIFLESFTAFQEKLSRTGFFNSLSQVLLKLFSPGVPDVYQGDELWNFSLVDPDNRRPVDYGLRSRMLERLKQDVLAAGEEGLAGFVRGLVKSPEDGRVKLYLTWKALTFRRENEHLMRDGEYERLEATGEKEDHIVVFARRLGGSCAVAVVPRLCAKLLDGRDSLTPGGPLWQDTWIQTPDNKSGKFMNYLTGEAVAAVQRDGRACLPAGKVLANFPVAVIVAA